MQYSDLPKATFIGVASNALDLSFLLEEAMIGTWGPFLYCDRARGGPNSCRILSQVATEYTETAPLVRAMGCTSMAIDLFRKDSFSKARFDPATPPAQGAVKSWEVSLASATAHHLVIVKAVWRLP